MAGAGLTLRRHVASDGSFVGYRITRSPEHLRFRVGDVITAVNGQAAEDSAAGTELMLVALRFPDFPVEILRAEP
jgi:hypothetical protein